MFLVDLFLPVKVLTVIKQFADRRISLGSDLHQVKFVLLGNLQRFFQGFNPQLVLFLVDEADGGNADLAVEAKMFGNFWKIRKNASG